MIQELFLCAVPEIVSDQAVIFITFETCLTLARYRNFARLPTPENIVMASRAKLHTSDVNWFEPF